MNNYILLYIFVSSSFLIKCDNPQKQYSLLMETYKKQIELCEKLKTDKAIIACKNKIILNLTKQNNENLMREKEFEADDHTSEILGHFAGVVTNFGKIVADPKNPANIGQALSNMVAGMINILATATKRMPNSREEVAKFIESIDSKTKTTLQDSDHNIIVSKS